MPVTSVDPIAFVPTSQPDAARAFYEGILGLQFVRDDGAALVFALGPHAMVLRIVRVPEFTPQPFTVLGWKVDDLPKHIDELTTKGVMFARFHGLPQDERGIWTAPGGDRIAWFHDLDNNVLSLSDQGA